MNISILQLHKRESIYFNYIQDKFAFNLPNKCFALSDGTTQSFNSAYWAKIITEYFVANPTFDNQQLIDIFFKCATQYKNLDFKFDSNSAIASLQKEKKDKGSTATFIGLQFLPNNQFNVISCGDTNLFLSKKEEKGYSPYWHFPYSNMEELKRNNSFINTEKLLKNEIKKESFKTQTFSYNHNDIIILATDALSRLLLKHPLIISELIKIENFEEFHKFCLNYWEAKEMEEDDISAIIIKTESKNTILQILPPESFSFPEKKPQLFTPTHYTQLQSNDMDIQEIKQSLNKTEERIQEIKNKMKVQETLLIITISIVLLNLLCFLYFQLYNNKVEQKNIKYKPDTTNINNKIAPKSKTVASDTTAIPNGSDSNMKQKNIITKINSPINSKDSSESTKEKTINKRKRDTMNIDSPNKKQNNNVTHN